MMLVLASSIAHAFTREQFRDILFPYDDQLKKISARGEVNSCPADYRKILGDRDVRFSIFFGYEDFEHETTDALHSKALVSVLRRPCQPRISACGFQVTEARTNFTRLKKTVDGRVFEINVSSTSVSENNVANRDPLWLRDRQERASEAVRARFYDDLNKADVVFYHGHSRIGGGLGFNSQSAIESGINYVLRIPLYPMLRALEKRPSNLKLFGIFSCSSEAYYRADVEKANPGLSLIVSKDELAFDENPQVLLGALDSLLGRKCAKDFDAAMISTSAGKRNMRFIRR